MSKNSIYWASRAIDVFSKDSPIPKRVLIFIGSDEDWYDVEFPLNRTTLFFKGRLYDWYGREVLLDDKISYVVYPMRFSGRKPGENYPHFETYLAQLKTGLYTEAKVEYDQKYAEMLKSSGNVALDYQCHALGPMALGAPRLTCIGPAFEDVRSSRGLGVGNCIMETMDPLGDIKILMNCQPTDLIHAVFTLFISKSDIPIHQSVCANRYDAMQRKRISANEVYDYERRGEVLCGDMIVTNNGKKLTTYFLDSYNTPKRISIDTDVIKATASIQKDCIEYYWYLDP